MPAIINNEILDLHWTAEDKDFDIAASGVLCKDIDEISAYITDVKDTVKVINLDNQPGLTKIPLILGDCRLLEEINISHTSVTEIPDFLFNLPNLRSLSCRCSELSSPPSGLANAGKLESLHLRINKNWPFPKEIDSLENLKVLMLDFYSDIALPDTLGTLKNLEKLSLSLKFKKGSSPNLPVSFKKHSSFKELCIASLYDKKKHDFKNTSLILASCPKFESLALCNLAMGAGYQKINSLNGLKQLELRHLIVEGNVFDSITSMQKLENLEVFGSGFKINKLPDIFDSLKELRKFSFAGNFICDLPPSIYGLTNLMTLEIGSLGISVLDEKIGNLKNLEKLHLYDNLLEKLPEAIFSLPNLSVLDIEDNVFRPGEINAVKAKLAGLEKNGQKIEFTADGQGRRQMVKRLRTLKNIASMDNALYFKYCLCAVNENPFAIKYVDKNKFKGTRFYAELCIAAVRKSCLALEAVDHSILEKKQYFHICIEAARSPDIASALGFIKDDLLSDHEYTQLYLEAALHNNNADFLNSINSYQIIERIGRKYYERICWAAVLHYPPAISKMLEPTEELIVLAEKRGYKRV